jgi:hypothetical protein
MASQNIVQAWRMTGSASWFHNDIDPLETIPFFPTHARSRCRARLTKRGTSPFNNRFLLPGSVELQANYVRYASRNVPQGRERARSSVDFSAKKALMNERAELVFTCTDIFNDFALQHEIQGRGFTALYQNFLDAGRDGRHSLPVLIREAVLVRLSRLAGCQRRAGADIPPFVRDRAQSQRLFTADRRPTRLARYAVPNANFVLVEPTA